MIGKRVFSAFLLFGVASSWTVARCQSPAESRKPAREIYVDEQCRLLPDAALGFSDSVDKSSWQKDSAICHLESVFNSHHVEKTVDEDGQSHSAFVTVAEQEYLLQNVTKEPAVFVVGEAVPKDWKIDSDPQPTQMIGSTAVFRVNAEPGQIVRLHVGMRHARPYEEAN